MDTMEFVEAREELCDRWGEMLGDTEIWNDLALDWFSSIAPAKTEEYGVEGLVLLGPMHCVSDFTGCYHRWKQMQAKGLPLTYAPMRNAVIDAFGYTVLMAILSGLDPNWVTVTSEEQSPQDDLDNLVGFYWQDQVPVDAVAVTLALRCVMNMYRRTFGD